LNGQPVAFTCASNPHRRGAALIARTAIAERVATGRNTLTIDVG